MKAITLYQPWASLVAIGAKGLETRDWEPKYRGPLAIHAAAKLDQAWLDAIEPRALHAMYRALHIDPDLSPREAFSTLPLGCVVATADLAACWKIWNGRSVGLRGVPCINQPNQWRAIIEPEYYFGDFTPGRYAWDLKNVVPLPVPIPAKGHQKLWNWSGFYVGIDLAHSADFTLARR